MIDIKQALNQAIIQLTNSSSSPRIDAEVLLAYMLGKSRTYLHAHPEVLLNQNQQETFHQLISKREQGTPISYITGTREFWSLELQVNVDTLIPRPETELLVELTLSLLADKEHAVILDLGTGSGAIALALAAERPGWQLIAADINPNAVNTTQNNASRLGLTNITTVCSDWFNSIPPGQVDAIVSNPPYIADDDPHLTQGDVRFEPRQALVSGPQGLDALNYLVKHSYERLLPGGLLIVEHGYNQRQMILAKFIQEGYLHPQCWQDWQGNDRVSGGWRT